MKIQPVLCIAVLFAASLQQPSSADAPKPMPAMQSAITAAATKASATGTVKNVDAKAGKITIAHGPVAALGWPAMTMAFAATPAQLASVHVGQQVDFEFVSTGMGGTLTRITPGK